MDLDEWNRDGLNLDGKKNKFKLAMSKFGREGQIGFQDHGRKVWYRCIRIKQLRDRQKITWTFDCPIAPHL